MAACNEDRIADPINGKVILEKNSNDMKVKMKLLILSIQQEFCEVLEKYEEDKKFHVNKWEHTDGRGGGITYILEDGNTFEKASISISVVQGVLTPFEYLRMKRNGVIYPDKMHFFAAGVTAFVHPKNPHVPSLHFSFRYFEVNLNKDKKDWWFGGCTHMTPYILNENDCQHFHEVLKSCCDKHNESYRHFKKKCDEYFYLPHRAENLGIGGIFFDDLNAPDEESCFQFVSAVAKCTVASYITIVENNMEKKYSCDDRHWQFLRRGRYVEFDLLYDTKWSLAAPGVHYENILMCLPPAAKWQFSHSPKEGSEEWKLLNVLRKPQDWV